MPIDVRCAACGQWYPAPDELAGQAVPCRSCGVEIPIPVSAVVVEEPSSPPAPFANIPLPDLDSLPKPPVPVTRGVWTAPPSSSSVSQAASQRRKYRTGFMVGIGVGVLGGVVGTALLIYVAFAVVGRKPKPPAAAPPPTNEGRPTYRPDPAVDQTVAELRIAVRELRDALVAVRDRDSAQAAFPGVRDAGAGVSKLVDKASDLGDVNAGPADRAKFDAAFAELEADSRQVAEEMRRVIPIPEGAKLYAELHKQGTSSKVRRIPLLKIKPPHTAIPVAASVPRAAPPQAPAEFVATAAAMPGEPAPAGFPVTLWEPQCLGKYNPEYNVRFRFDQADKVRRWETVYWMVEDREGTVEFSLSSHDWQSRGTLRGRAFVTHSVLPDDAGKFKTWLEMGGVFSGSRKPISNVVEGVRHPFHPGR